MEEETLYFIAEKLAYRPRVVFIILLFCPVSCWTKPDTLQIAEEIFRRSTIRERTGFKLLSRCYLRTGRTNYRSMQITWRWYTFHWKQISRMEANSRSIRPTKYKRFTVFKNALKSYTFSSKHVKCSIVRTALVVQKFLTRILFRYETLFPLRAVS